MLAVMCFGQSNSGIFWCRIIPDTSVASAIIMFPYWWSHTVRNTGGFCIPKYVQPQEHSRGSDTDGIPYERPNPDNPRNVSYLNRNDDEWHDNWNNLDNRWNRNELVLRRRLSLHYIRPRQIRGLMFVKGDFYASLLTSSQWLKGVPWETSIFSYQELWFPTPLEEKI